MFNLGFPSKFSLNEIRENERNSFIFVQNFREFRCIFDPFSFNFRSIKIEMFQFSRKRLNENLETLVYLHL